MKIKIKIQVKIKIKIKVITVIIYSRKYIFAILCLLFHLIPTLVYALIFRPSKFFYNLAVNLQ